MAPVHKLTYFDVSALGEVTRFLFRYGGIEFTDERISSEQWPALKPSKFIFYIYLTSMRIVLEIIQRGTLKLVTLKPRSYLFTVCK